MKFVLLAVMAMGVLSPSELLAETKVRVVVHPYDEVVIAQPDGSWGGFEVDLLRAIAVRNAWECEFIEVKDLDKLLGHLEKGEAEIGLAGLTPTLAREERVDFSYPVFQTGYSVVSPLVSELPLWKRILVFVPPLLGLMAIVVIVMILARFSERKEGEPIWGHTMDASLRVLQVLAGGAPSDIKGDRVDPNAKELRILGLVTVALGWLMVTLIADSWVHFQQTPQAVPQYSRPDQIKDMVVATKRHSSSLGVMKRAGIVDVVEVGSTAEIIEGLQTNQFRVGLFDTHALIHEINKAGLSDVFGVAAPFDDQYDALAVRPGWEHLEELNRGILELESLGMLKMLQDRYYPERMAHLY